MWTSAAHKSVSAWQSGESVEVSDSSHPEKSGEAGFSRVGFSIGFTIWKEGAGKKKPSAEGLSVVLPNTGYDLLGLDHFRSIQRDLTRSKLDRRDQIKAVRHLRVYEVDPQDVVGDAVAILRAAAKELVLVEVSVREPDPQEVLHRTISLRKESADRTESIDL